MDAAMVVAWVTLADILRSVPTDDTIGKLLAEYAVDMTTKQGIVKSKRADMEIIKVVDSDFRGFRGQGDRTF